MEFTPWISASLQFAKIRILVGVKIFIMARFRFFKKEPITAVSSARKFINSCFSDKKIESL